MAEPLPVLQFVPLARPLPWGGRELERVLGKVLPDGVSCGESWEVVDLPTAQSVVDTGPLAATALDNLVRSRREELLGEVQPADDRFPVLFKFIDARQMLSVQVHPDEAACRRLGGGARPKTEVWYVLRAEPDARLYLGLRPGVDEGALRAALSGGQAVEALREVPLRPGEFHLLPAGLVHAVGGGVLLAEILQGSDTTFRLFDWNRLGPDGRPRELHVEQALSVIDYELSPDTPPARPLSGRPGVRCPAFSVERLGLGPGALAPLDAGRPRILACVEGAGQLLGAGASPLELRIGQTCLVPACRAGHLVSAAGGVFLLVRV